MPQKPSFGKIERVHVVARIYTRDFKCPIVAGDTEFEYGWKCIPQAPTADPDWEIFDESKDYKTGWQRLVRTIVVGGDV